MSRKRRKVKLTQAAVTRLPVPDGKRVYYYDEAMPGLAVCCWPSGTKTFMLYRKINGRPIRVKIGRFGDLTAKQAREQAAKLAGEIAQGADPAEARRKTRSETTLGELWELYLEKHAKPRKRSWEEDQRKWDAYITTLRGRRLSQIRRADVRDFHAKVGREHGHCQANRVLALLSSMFSFAQGEGFEGQNPCKGVKRFKERSRDRFLMPDELPRFMEALKQEAPPWGDFFSVLLLTGARIHNLQAMRWQDLELRRGLWRIPSEESKTGEPLLVVLIDTVVNILRHRWQVNEAKPQAEQSKYVFPGRRDGHIGYPQAAWRRIKKRADLEDLRPHDLRRSLASWAVGAGASLHVVGKALGHNDPNATAVYARLHLDPVRQAVESATDAMLASARALPVLDPQAASELGENEL